jgi:hypothetical protein
MLFVCAFEPDTIAVLAIRLERTDIGGYGGSPPGEMPPFTYLLCNDRPTHVK